MIPNRDIADAPVGTLFQRLLDDGRAYLRAEMDVARASMRARVGSARTAIILGVAAIFLVQAGLTMLFLALGSALTLLLGPPWAGQLLAAIIALAMAGLMVKYAASHFTPPATSGSGGREEPS